ncbi:MAG: dehydrogenase [Phycisphaerae bacterium]|nr:dehydrogenase [Phycisphaerae bacterium]
MSDRRRRALVTGASSGIGAAYARRLAAQGYDLVITARREDRLDSLSGELGATHGVEVLSVVLDLAKPDAVTRLVEVLDANSIEVDYLVCNAGYALDQDFLDAEYQRHHDFLQVLLGSLVELSHALSPGMVERGWGRIVNVASVASYLSLTPGSLYGPVKSFVLAFSRSLKASLHSQGVHVTALCPGYTRTEFFRNIGVEDKVFGMPGFLLLDVDHVVAASDRAVERGKSVCIPGFFYKVLIFSSRFLPLGIFASRKFRQTLPTSR